MDIHELRLIAKKYGFVRWNKSGIIEQVHVARNKIRNPNRYTDIYVKNIITGQGHLLFHINEYN